MTSARQQPWRHADLRRRIAVGCRILANAGLSEDVLGHVSVRLDDDTLLVRARGPDERGAAVHDAVDDVVAVLAATAQRSPRAPTTRCRTSCRSTSPATAPTRRSRAVVHAHPPAVVAADLAGVPLVPLVGAYNIPAARLAAGGIAGVPAWRADQHRRARRRDGRGDGRPAGVRAARPRGDDDRRVARAGRGPGPRRRLAGPHGVRASSPLGGTPTRARRRRPRPAPRPRLGVQRRACSGGTTSSAWPSRPASDEAVTP